MGTGVVEVLSVLGLVLIVLIAIATVAYTFVVRGWAELFREMFEGLKTLFIIGLTVAVFLILILGMNLAVDLIIEFFWSK